MLAPGDANNNSSQSFQSGENFQTLSASSAASVGKFYRKLQESQGPVLDQLLCGDICLKGESAVDYPRFLQELSKVSSSLFLCISVLHSHWSRFNKALLIGRELQSVACASNLKLVLYGIRLLT